MINVHYKLMICAYFPGLSQDWYIIIAQYISCASLQAHLVKNLPAMQETQVQFLGQEDPLEKG